MNSAALLESFAGLLEYPQAGAAEALAILRSQWPPDLPGAGHLEAFGAWLAVTPLPQQEEAYTALFDLQPACSLHLGHHLFGEDRRRSAFLVGLAAHYRQGGMAGGRELPDHLPLLLHYLATARPQAGDADLVALVLVPSLRKIMANLPGGSPWRPLFQALTEVVTTTGAAPGERTSE